MLPRGDRSEKTHEKARKKSKNLNIKKTTTGNQIENASAMMFKQKLKTCICQFFLVVSKAISKNHISFICKMQVLWLFCWIVIKKKSNR